MHTAGRSGSPISSSWKLEATHLSSRGRMGKLRHILTMEYYTLLYDTVLLVRIS